MADIVGISFLDEGEYDASMLSEVARPVFRPVIFPHSAAK